MPENGLSLGTEIARALGVDLSSAHKVVITIEARKLVDVVVSHHVGFDKEMRVAEAVKGYSLVERDSSP